MKDEEDSVARDLLDFFLHNIDLYLKNVRNNNVLCFMQFESVIKPTIVDLTETHPV